MADRAKKISELTALTTASGDDLLVIVDSPAASPTTRKITLNNLFANVSSNVVFTNNVTASGNTSFSKLNVAGNTVANTISSIDLIVTGNTIANNLTSANLTSTSLTITGNTVANTITSTGLTVTGNTIVNNIFFANTTNTPANSTSTGVLGEVRVDNNYIYVCTSTNNWKRSSISTW
jgi:hypothetical protein